MPFVTRKTLLVLGGLSAAAVFAAGGFVWSGVYNIAADDLHTRPVYALMDTMRERSIAVRANKLHPPPNLDDPALIRQGAGNYNAMCMSCHLAPGMAETELSKGLYPAPPNLSKQTVDAASAFWVIKHGIKASGMPSWGKSMSDEYIWNMVAFLQKMPEMSPEQYQALVATSGGHDHGGGESMPHDDTMPAMEGMDSGSGDHHGAAAPAAHDDTGSAPHAHDAPAPAPAPHDDAGAPPHDHDTPAPPPHDDAGSPPHDH